MKIASDIDMDYFNEIKKAKKNNTIYLPKLTKEKSIKTRSR